MVTSLSQKIYDFVGQCLVDGHKYSNIHMVGWTIFRIIIANRLVLKATKQVIMVCTFSEKYQQSRIQSNDGDIVFIMHSYTPNSEREML